MALHSRIQIDLYCVLNEPVLILSTQYRLLRTDCDTESSPALFHTYLKGLIKPWRGHQLGAWFSLTSSTFPHICNVLPSPVGSHMSSVSSPVTLFNK